MTFVAFDRLIGARARVMARSAALAVLDEDDRRRSEVIPAGREACGAPVTIAHGHILWFAVVHS